jgi:hypothetical protein
MVSQNQSHFTADRQFLESEHCESLQLWDGESSGTKEGERPPLEDDTRGLVWDIIPR